MIFHVTSACNFNCSYCFVDPAAKELTLLNWISICERNDGEDRHLDISGGEPLLKWNDIVKPLIEWQAAKYANMAYNFHISTNGSLVTDEIAKFLADNKVTCTVSLHGDEKYVDSISKTGQYASIMAGVKKLTDAGARVNLRMVLTKDNLSCVPYFVELSKQYPGSIIQKLFGESADGITKEQEDTFLAEYRGKIQLNSTFHGGFKCYVPSITIRPDGKAIPCGAQWNRVLGDMLTEDWSTIMKRTTEDMVFGCRGITEYNKVKLDGTLQARLYPHLGD